MADWITIGSDQLTARINPLGAELSSLTDSAGRELMTDADPAFWTGRAPLLFPIVGRLNGDVLRVDGREYPMKQHGFARRMMFTVSEQEEGWAVLSLDASTETRRSYPFEFKLRVLFKIEGQTLSIEVEVHNPDRQRSLPASFGFHPAFAWPLPYGRPRDAHCITFAGDEPGPVKRLDDGLIAGDRLSPLTGRALHLTDALFAADVLIWDPIASRTLTYGADTGPQLRVENDAPQLGIWTKPGARFVCIEPWHGHADPVGYTGEFRDKPGIFTVSPGGSKRIGMDVTLVS